MERRQVDTQFQALHTQISDNHQEVVQRLTSIEVFQKTDRADFAELKVQCDKHDEVITKGKGIVAFLSLIGALGAWQWISDHVPKLGK